MRKYQKKKMCGRVVVIGGVIEKPKLLFKKNQEEKYIHMYEHLFFFFFFWHLCILLWRAGVGKVAGRMRRVVRGSIVLIPGL